MTPPKLAIAINLDDLRDLMRQFMSEVVTDNDNNIYAWPFETFLQWLRRKRQETANADPKRVTNLRSFKTTER